MASETATKPVEAQQTRPHKPDEEKFRADLNGAQKELEAVQTKLDAIRAKIKDATGKGPHAEKSAELQSQLKEIRDEQAQRKGGKQKIFDELKSLDDGIKRKIKDLQTSKSKISFKSLDEIDSRIKSLDSGVESGQMKIVEEKKALQEISQLKKQRKIMAGFADTQTTIDADKAKLSEIKSQLDDPQSKELSERYNKVQAELKSLRTDQDAAFKSRSDLFDQRNTLQEQREAKFSKVKTLQREHFAAKDRYHAFEQEERKKQRERRRAERETYENEKRKKNAERILEKATEPAFGVEILTCENLLKYFDPSYTTATTVTKDSLEAKNRRAVDAMPEGAKVVTKDDLNSSYFVGEKKKKQHQSKAPTIREEKFSLSIATMEELNSVGIDAPMNSGEVSKTVEALKKKLQYYQDHQEEKTKENIAKAEADISKEERRARERADKQGKEKDSARIGSSNPESPPKTGKMDENVANGAVADEHAELAVEDVPANA